MWDIGGGGGTKNEKSKDYCKADLKQRVLFFITIFLLAIPAFFRFTDVTELMLQSQYYIDGECRNKNCLKGRCGNDLQKHKNWKAKLLKRWITTIRHGGLGHEVQWSWPYLSNATPWPYELSHVKNELSLVGLTACQYENG